MTVTNGSTQELQCGSDPWSASQPSNHDNDDFCDGLDDDDDGDNIQWEDQSPIRGSQGTRDHNDNGCYGKEDDTDGDNIMDDQTTV